MREDYSAHGEAWDYFPHDHARSRAYRWSEDGLAAVCDGQQTYVLGLALWNGQDPILKERIFGLTDPEGNHGEDAKEYWWYLDSTPTHSWMSWRYHCPQREFPFGDLIAENGRRAQDVGEYELVDTGIFLDDSTGRRPVFGTVELFQSHPDWHGHVPFYEFFHGDTGRGVGASHETGWTDLVADLILRGRGTVG